MRLPAPPLSRPPHSRRVAALFVGAARRADATYLSTGGSVVPARPTAQTFWATSGTRTATWKIRNGHWRVVVMNADASPGVSACARVGVTIRGALPVALSLLGAARQRSPLDDARGDPVRVNLRTRARGNGASRRRRG